MDQVRALDLGPSGSCSVLRLSLIPTTRERALQHFTGNATHCRHKLVAGSSLLLVCPLGWLIWTHASRTTFTVHPSQSMGPTYPSAAAYAGLGQLFLLSHPWEWLTHTFTMWTSCTLLPRQRAGPALLSAATSKGQSQLTCFHDPAVLAFPSATGWQGTRHQSCTHVTSQQMSGRTSSSVLFY